MDDERKKVKKGIAGLFILCMCIALLCFGICAYLVLTYRGAGVEKRIVTLSQAIALAGVFFLVVDFGYLLPVLLSGKAKKTGGAAGIFDEGRMRQALEQYIPQGETLLAGIHAVVNESNVTSIFSRCICTEERLLPSKEGGTAAVTKKKYSTYDVYMGITQDYLVIADCQKNSYLYQFDKDVPANGADIQELTSELLLADIGKCFPLSDIESCETKKGWMGSVKCLLKMKNGSYFKLMIPKLAGLGDGMPHHAQYRDKIIERLS